MPRDCTHDDATGSSTLTRLLGLHRCGSCGKLMGRSHGPSTPEVVLQPRAGERWGLTSFPAFLGRSAACVRVEDPLVSRVHARIVPTPGGFCIEDMGSMNGLFVDGIRVRSALLSPGSTIRIGNTELLVARICGLEQALQSPAALAPRPETASRPEPPPPPPPRPRPSAAPRVPSGAARTGDGAARWLGSFVLGSACTLQAALVALLLALLVFQIGAADRAAVLVALSVLGVQCILALALLMSLAFETSRGADALHASHS